MLRNALRASVLTRQHTFTNTTTRKRLIVRCCSDSRRRWYSGSYSSTAFIYGGVLSWLVPTKQPEEEGDDEVLSQDEDEVAETVDENIMDVELVMIEEEDKDGTSRWNGLELLRNSLSIAAFSNALSSWTWSSTLDFSATRAKISTLFFELGLGPGSIYSQIVHDPPDTNIHPEVEWDAEVRLGEELCLSERAFLRERRRGMREAFAKLIGVPEQAVDERDVPIVAIAGSGGGYRAMLNTVGSLLGAQESGLLSCVTYTAGVSGSCWALTVLYSGVAGSHNLVDVARHIKDRIQSSYLDMSTLDALTTPPTNKYLLSGLLRKAAGPSGVASLVDVYGTLLSSRLLVPDEVDKLDPQTLSLHLLRRGIDNGQLPLPIFTAIQHATPPETLQAIELAQREKRISVDYNRESYFGQVEQILRDRERFFWYEFTPFEVGCDEIGAWIPSWSLGRRFNQGKSVERKPEIGLSILSGIFGSAFCASLKLYFAEVKPTLQELPFQLYNWLEDIVNENMDTKSLGRLHPVLPDQLPNFLKGLDGQLRDGCPSDLAERDYMSFMDAGAELNIPYYPLLRRNVDCIIALDASADSQDLWFTRAEELAAKRGLRGWPKGARWPTEVHSNELPTSANATALNAQDPAAEAANLRLAQSQQSELAGQADRQESTDDREIPNAAADAPTRTPSLSSCEVWIGSSQPTEVETSRLDELDEEALLQRDGIGVVYIPLAPNEEKVPGFDPFVISTWRRECTLEESQCLLDVAEANFMHSKDKIVRLLRAIWLRKRHERERTEWRARLHRFRVNMSEAFQSH